MRKPGTQPHNERGGATGGDGTSGGAKKATHDDEQDQRGRFTKNNNPAGPSERPAPAQAPTEQQRGERAPQLEHEQPAERHVPTDPSP
jgi:hypothetical protein